jgi:hypothetical protein
VYTARGLSNILKELISQTNTLMTRDEMNNQEFEAAKRLAMSSLYARLSQHLEYLIDIIKVHKKCSQDGDFIPTYHFEEEGNSVQVEYSNIRDDFKKNLQLNDEEFKKSFPEIIVLQEDLETFTRSLTDIAGQEYSFKLYCERFLK